MAEVHRLQVVVRVQAAAGQHHVLDAGGEGIPQDDAGVEAVQLLQKAALLGVHQGFEMVPVVLPDGGGSGGHQALGQPRLPDAVPLAQRREDRGGVLLLHLPDVGLAASLAGAGVGHVKDMAQPVAVGVQEGDALGPRLDPAVETPVPPLHLNAGGGVRLLRVDEHLVPVVVFVHPGGGGEKVHPGPPALGELGGGVGGQLGYGLKSCCHRVPSNLQRNGGASADAPP